MKRILQSSYFTYQEQSSLIKQMEQTKIQLQQTNNKIAEEINQAKEEEIEEKYGDTPTTTTTEENIFEKLTGFANPALMMTSYLQ